MLNKKDLRAAIFLALIPAAVLTYLSIGYERKVMPHCQWEGCNGVVPAWGYPFSYIVDSTVVTETLIGRPSLLDGPELLPLIGDLLFYEAIVLSPYLVWELIAMQRKERSTNKS